MTVLEANGWFEAALELDAENRLLRMWMTNMLILIAQRDELLAYGCREIERRWPEPGERP